MLSKKVSLDGAQFASPADAIWSQTESQDITLMPVPVGMQPSVYIKTTMGDREIGKVKKVKVSCLHNGSDIAVRMEWADPDKNLERTDANEFPDGCALMFPMGEDAPLVTMGSTEQPVNLWHWRADRPETAYCNLAGGVGTTEVNDMKTIKTTANYMNGKWSIVFTRPLSTSASGTLTSDSANHMKQFAAGAKTKLACAVWEGGNGERGGLKAFSPAWVDIELES